MTHDQFWNIIADSRSTIHPTRCDGNFNRQAARLKQLLSAMPVEEVQEFDRIFNQFFGEAFRWDLWAAAYILAGGCSDDGFTDFRYWLISMGREVYDAAIADPESLAEVGARPDIEAFMFEQFGCVAFFVLKDKSVPKPTELPGYRHPRDPVGEPWTDDDLPKRFPKLWAKFGQANTSAASPDSPADQRPAARREDRKTQVKQPGHPTRPWWKFW